MSKDVVITDNWLDSVAFDANGLIPAIAQCVQTQRVLMVAWMNLEALQATLQTQQATYYSRSRKALWHKGEESGNTQHVKEIRLDCDGDVIILQVEQKGGVACHTGRESCFYYRLDTPSNANPRWVATDPVLVEPSQMYASQPKAQAQDKQPQQTAVHGASDTLKAVFDVIQSRIAAHASATEPKTEGANNSYVASLVQKGPNAVLKKVGEEACELVMACKDRDAKAIVAEAADLWFHSMVALASHNATITDVLLELNRRMGVSGLTEKASRSS